MQSTAQRNAPPRRNPTVAGNQAGNPWAREISIAGARSDQKLAAIITPAAKPIIESRTTRFMSRKRKTTLAPSAVTAQVKRHASNACMAG